MTGDDHALFRFATVHVSGRRARSQHINVRRLTTLLDVAWQIDAAHWHSLEAVILPSGFFHHDEYMGGEGLGGYKRKIKSTLFHDFVMEALEILRDSSPFAFIVAGIDTFATSKQAGETLSVAWDRKGVAGIGHGRYRQAQKSKPTAVLPASNNTGETILIRLFEAQF